MTDARQQDPLRPSKIEIRLRRWARVLRTRRDRV